MSDKEAGEIWTRMWYKCSFCRHHRVKCQPEDRDWEGTRMKCVYCLQHKLPCSKNYKSKEDPGVERTVKGQPALVVSDAEGTSQNTLARQSEATTAHTKNSNVVSDAKGPGDGVDTTGSPSTGMSPSNDRGVCLEGQAERDLWAQAMPELKKLNMLGSAFSYFSRLAPVSCQAPSMPRDYNRMFEDISSMIKKEVHSLFKSIYELGSQAITRRRNDLAQQIFSKLLHALTKRPGLYDHKKLGVLLKMAVFFKPHDIWESEYIYGVVADLCETSARPLHNNPFLLVAESFDHTSEELSQLLADLWRKRFPADSVPTNLCIPPRVRAAGMLNGETISTMLSRRKGVHTDPSILDLQPLHVAATFGLIHNLNQLMKAGASIGDRDSHQLSPLFITASNGHDLCCVALLKKGANHMDRDAHGHTMLEVAAQRGFLTVVQRLVKWGAEVNPTLPSCPLATSPLHAAIGSNSFGPEIAQYLINKGADWSLQCFHIKKNAIDLAKERGFSGLVEFIHQKRDLDFRSGQTQRSSFGQDPLLASANVYGFNVYDFNGTGLSDPSFNAASFNGVDVNGPGFNVPGFDGNSFDGDGYIGNGYNGNGFSE